MITSRAVFALHYSITGVSPRRHAATRDYAEALLVGPAGTGCEINGMVSGGGRKRCVVRYQRSQDVGMG